MSIAVTDSAAKSIAQATGVPNDVLQAFTRGPDGVIRLVTGAAAESIARVTSAPGPNGVATLAAVSAPTALAVDAARSCGLALAGFVRGEGLVAYTFAERLGLCEAPRAGEHR